MKHVCKSETGNGCDHRSDCSVHNEPAWPEGPCDCGLAGSTWGAALPGKCMDTVAKAMDHSKERT